MASFSSLVGRPVVVVLCWMAIACLLLQLASASVTTAKAEVTTAAHATAGVVHHDIVTKTAGAADHGQVAASAGTQAPSGSGASQMMTSTSALLLTALYAVCVRLF